MKFLKMKYYLKRILSNIFINKSINFFHLLFFSEAPGELGWLLTLIIVSLISAVIGAVIMVTILHWRRFKTSGSRGKFI